MELKNKSPLVPVTIIAIDGKGGAGKTTVAMKFAEKLGAQVIHTDDFTTFDKPAFDGSDLVLSEVIQPIIDGHRTLSYRRLQVWPGEPDSVTDQPVTDTLILEGCGASCAKFRPYVSYTIAVDLDDKTRIERIIQRDVVEGGRDADDNDEIGKLWEEKENEYFNVDDPRKRADVTVSTMGATNIADIINLLT